MKIKIKKFFNVKMNSDVSSLLISINKLVGEECTLPGNWSPKIFYDDIMNAPVSDSNILISSMKSLIHSEKPMSYCEFFFVTRGYEKKLTPYQKEIYSLFENGSLMLYFEEIFLSLLNSEKERNEDLIKFLSALGTSPIYKWNDILANIGACHYLWFAKEYSLYLPLLNRKDQSSFENYTDAELFQYLGLELKEIGLDSEIRICDSRRKLIEFVKNLEISKNVTNARISK